MRPYEHHLRSTRRCTFSVVKLTTTNKGVEPLDRTEELKSKGYVLLLAHGPPPPRRLSCLQKQRPQFAVGTIRQKDPKCCRPFIKTI